MSKPLQFEMIDRAGLELAQKGLLPKDESGDRGGEAQRDFIHLAAEDPEGFVAVVRSWGIRPGATPPVVERRLTEREFIDPPWSTECMIATTWSALSPNQASRPEAWTRIHLEMIARGLIRSSYLAANGSGESGRTRIAQALKGRDAQKVDACVRAVLRRLGGVIGDRAYRTAFLDCPLAKAWWRHRYAQETHAVFGRDSVEALSGAIRPSIRWEALVQAMVSRLTIIGDSAIRPAIIQSLAEGAGESSRSMEGMLLWIGRTSTVRALGALGSDYVLQMIEERFLDSREAK